MMLRTRVVSMILLFLLITGCGEEEAIQQTGTDQAVPHLKKQGTATQLIVDGKPFLMLAGEVGNSTASDPDYIRPFWDKFQRINMNTVLAPVYWNLVEPEEGTYNFAEVDSLIVNARKHNLKLVLLWFGSWKNSMSCYTPGWVKTDQERFPRARTRSGRGLEILTPFSVENRNADKRAFVALMKHIKEFDRQHHTVVMMQVENEIGMIPEARDYSDPANRAYSDPVPEKLISYLNDHRDNLIPEFREIWRRTGFNAEGTWTEVFGRGVQTDEIFMAWHFSRYVEEIAGAGKEVYPLPVYVNAALIREGEQPGEYPSAGPLPHLMDVWRAGAPSIDFLSPDIYFPNFAEWCRKYHRSGNPLFIPEAGRGSASVAHVFYAIGQHDAMGFSPFSIEDLDPETHRLPESYDVLGQLSSLILQHQGQGTMAGVLLRDDKRKVSVNLGEYTFNISHHFSLPWSQAEEYETWPRTGAIIIERSPHEFIVGGTGVVMTFQPSTPGDPIAGIEWIEEGEYIDGKWVPGRRMNGDQSHQGRHLSIPFGQHNIQHIKLYRYE